MMDLRTAAGTGGDASAKLVDTTPSGLKASTIDSPIENGKVNSHSRNSSVKSFNIDGLIGDRTSDNNTTEPQIKRRRTSTSTTDSNSSHHSAEGEEEEEDIDVQSEDNLEADEKSADSLLLEPSNDKLGLLKRVESLVGSRRQSPLSQNITNVAQCGSESSGGTLGSSSSHVPLVSLASSNPFAAAAAAAAAAVSGFSPSNNLLTPFMQNAALGKFFGKSTLLYELVSSSCLHRMYRHFNTLTSF